MVVPAPHSALVVLHFEFAISTDHNPRIFCARDKVRDGLKKPFTARFAPITACSAMRLEVPPMWNVRNVSCVPGSPTLCAAITPTASQYPRVAQWRDCAHNRLCTPPGGFHTSIQIARERIQYPHRQFCRPIFHPTKRRLQQCVHPQWDLLHPRAPLRPTMRSDSGSTDFFALFRASISMPNIVPQSASEIITSARHPPCAASNSPLRAVFNAVSANPLRLPCVEIKYSSTLSPSLSDEIIGVSIISPMPRSISFGAYSSGRACPRVV